MKLLAIIPARGGSKGIPRKNVKLLAGKPLIGWTIEAARQAACIDRIVVSTEDIEIASVARALGADVPFMRPDKLAADDTPGIAPVLHALEMLPEFDWVLLLQPTSPLRTAVDINGIVVFCRENKAQSAVSVHEVAEHPYWMYQRDADQCLKPLIQGRPVMSRRQDMPQAYSLNGALYLAHVDWLVARKSFIGSDTRGYVMPKERSVDIDTPEDWCTVEKIMTTYYAD